MYQSKADLVQQIIQEIKTNNNREIIGSLLQTILINMLDTTSHSSVKETFIVDNTIITNGGVTLAHTPLVDSEHVILSYDGIMMEEGVGNDYTINGSDINFERGLVLGLKIVILYKTTNII